MFQINRKFRMLVSTVVILPMIFSLAVPAGIIFADENGAVIEEQVVADEAPADTTDTSDDATLPAEVDETASLASDSVDDEEEKIEEEVQVSDTEENIETDENGDINDDISDEEVGDTEGLMMRSSLSVAPETVQVVYQCLTPDSLGDSVVITPGASSSGEKPLQQLLNDEGFTNTVGSDQKGYQIWNTSNSSTTIEIQFIDQGARTANGNLVGYYTNGDKATFVPLFRTNNNSHPSYAGLPVFSKGQKISVNVLDASNLSFAIVSQAPNSL